MASALSSLPPFPSVANEILALSRHPEVDLGQIASACERDAAFAAESLILANSPLFGLRSRVFTVRHAVSILGLDRMYSLALAVALRVWVGRSGGPPVRACWHHSAAAAILCQLLSAEFDLDEDRAYTAGLMHDVGRLGLLKAFPDELESLYESTYVDAMETMRVERTLVEVDHGTAGAWLVKTWAFPDVFPRICEHHHQPFQENEDSNLMRAIKMSCRLANTLGFSAVKYQEKPPVDEIYAAGLPHMRYGLVPSEEDLRQYVTERLDSFTG